MKTNIFCSLALCTLAATALTLTGCSKDELATDLTTNGGNGPIRIAAIGIEGAAETRAAIAEGTFVGSANPGPNEVKTAFAVGDMVYLRTTDNDGTEYPADESLTATLQADGSWAMTNEALRPADGKTWKSVRLEHYPEVNDDFTTDIPDDPSSKTPAMTRYHDQLIADNDAAKPRGTATIVNGAITATLTHACALLTIAPEAIVIGGEFKTEGYTTIATLRASMGGVKDTDDQAGNRFPFTPMGEPVATAAGNQLWQAIAPTSTNITSLHIRLAKPDGTRSDEMEIAMKPDATDGNGNAAPGFALTTNHRYKLKLSLYNAGAMKVEVPAEYPSWGEEEEIKNNIFFIKDAEDLKTFATAVNVGNTTAKGVVTADFEFDPTTGSSTWTGIGYNNPYTGTFDGQGHTITYTNTTAVSYGLFSEVGANGTVKNITVKGGKIQNYSNTHAGIADNNYGTVENCHVTDIDFCNTTSAGGVVGQNLGGKVIACSATHCTMNGAGSIGAVVVANKSNTVGSEITNGAVVGCIGIGCTNHGSALNNAVEIKDVAPAACYAASVASGITADNIAAMNTALAAITPATNYRWIKDDDDTPKVIDYTTATPPTGTVYIYNVATLIKFRNIANGEGGETKNIAVKGIVFNNFTYNNDTDGGWGGIGSGGEIGGYHGIFDGGGHTITFIGNAESGLFYQVEGGTVKNITVKGSTVSNYNNTGTIANAVFGGTIENCHAIDATTQAGNGAGGVVGQDYNNSHIYACSATNCTISSSFRAGAVIGINGGTITACIAIGCTPNKVVDVGILPTACYAASTAAGIGNAEGIDPNGAVTEINKALADKTAWRWKYDNSAFSTYIP